jgi:cell fate regulator YaaT (PSP1 superfamily)
MNNDIKNITSYIMQNRKHSCYDWLNNIDTPTGLSKNDIVEVSFKNDRKDFFKLPEDLSVNIGDLVAVEANPGHDIGIVTLTGETVKLQMRKKGFKYNNPNTKKIYRKARPADIEKWEMAKALEEPTMHKAREIAFKLGLVMKICDVEYQGDKTKAIFYYTAEDRVDFRELIKIMAETFMVRIEMRQIGVRQEASRLGGLAPCGREHCCSTWICEFKSVATNAARVQQMSMNPQKLAGQCGKLKCCLNYEHDCYAEALKEFPDTSIILKSKEGEAIYQKIDVFKKIITYSLSNNTNNFINIPLDRVMEIINLNKQGIIPDSFLLPEEQQKEQSLEYYNNIVGQDSLARFDKKEKKKKKKKKRKNTIN